VGDAVDTGSLFHDGAAWFNAWVLVHLIRPLLLSGLSVLSGAVGIRPTQDGRIYPFGLPKPPFRTFSPCHPKGRSVAKDGGAVDRG